MYDYYDSDSNNYSPGGSTNDYYEEYDNYDNDSEYCIDDVMVKAEHKDDCRNKCFEDPDCYDYLFEKEGWECYHYVETAVK